MGYMDQRIYVFLVVGFLMFSLGCLDDGGTKLSVEEIVTNSETAMNSLDSYALDMDLLISGENPQSPEAGEMAIRLESSSKLDIMNKTTPAGIVYKSKIRNVDARLEGINRSVE